MFHQSLRRVAFFMLFATASWTFFACKGNENKPVPDTSGIEVKVVINRFEQALFGLDTANIYESIEKMNEKYADFTDVYFSGIMGFRRDYQDTSKRYVEQVASFINYPSIRNLYDTCQTVYGDLSELETELEQAFKFYKYYFPKKPTPTVTTFISEYGLAVGSIGEESLILGLDMFLGENFAPYSYPPVQLPRYITRTMDKRYITPKLMEALCGELVGTVEGNRLIDYMVHNGKRLYLLDLLQPTAPDSVRLAITEAQVKWLTDNEFRMWQEVFVPNLYQTNLKKGGLLGLIETAPTSPGMPNESPGGAGNWVGWQIVKRYMANNPTVTLEQLLENKDAQKILEASRYKPK